MGGKKRNNQQSNKAAKAEAVEAAAGREASVAEQVPEKTDEPGVEAKPEPEILGK